MRAAILAVILAAVLASCGENRFVASLYYLKPYNFEDLTCAQLKERANYAVIRGKEFTDLKQRAAAESPGSTIGTMVYGPDDQRTTWERHLYEDEFARRNCPTDPPKANPPK